VAGDVSVCTLSFTSWLFFCCESRAGLPQSPSKSREDACTQEDNLVKGASAGLSVVYKHEWHAPRPRSDVRRARARQRNSVPLMPALPRHI
jgi:hypothetical protein